MYQGEAKECTAQRRQEKKHHSGGENPTLPGSTRRAGDLETLQLSRLAGNDNSRRRQKTKTRNRHPRNGSPRPSHGERLSNKLHIWHECARGGGGGERCCLSNQAKFRGAGASWRASSDILAAGGTYHGREITDFPRLPFGGVKCPPDTASSLAASSP